MKNATILYRIIKSIQGFILLALGIVLSIFFNNENLFGALGYTVGSVLLVYGILTIAFSYLFQRGIASFDMLSGVIISAISIFIFINPHIITEFLPLFFSTTLLIYSIILIIELIIHILKKNTKKIIIYTFSTIICLTSGILTLIFSLNNQTTNYIVLIIGLILIIIGLFIIFYSLCAPKKDVLVTSNSIINSPKEVENKNELSTEISKKPAKLNQNKQKRKKAQKTTTTENTSETLSIEDKNIKEIEYFDNENN